MRIATNAIFTQMQATNGFKLFGDNSVAAMLKELKQLEHGPIPRKRVLRALDPDSISSEEKKRL